VAHDSREVVYLTAREWQLYTAITARKTTSDVAEEWGVSRQAVDNVRRNLERKGVITRVDGNPWWRRHNEVYPWVLTTDIETRPHPVLPAGTTLTAHYPRHPTHDHTIDPIRLVRWEEWVVQSLTPVRTQHGSTHQASSTYRVVWCWHPNGEWGFSVPLTAVWTESHTAAVFELHGVTLNGRDRETLTQIISAVTGVDYILDITHSHHRK
jgi:DNA-binding Lrp family transcriptional regulator